MDEKFIRAVSEWNQAIHAEQGASAFVGDSQLIGMTSWQLRFAEYIWKRALGSSGLERGK